MPYAIAPLCGVLITLMNSINSRFALAAGALPSVVVIHLVGLAAISLLIAARRERRRASPQPPYLYLGGVVGVGTVVSCNIAFGSLGASLAVALALFGQAAFSLMIDATGLLGRAKYAFNVRAVPGLAIAAFGIAVMAGSDFTNLQYAPAAVLAGVFPALSFTLNSQLAQRVGVFSSTRANYATGLATSAAVLAVAAAAGFQPFAGFAEFGSALMDAGAATVLGGGVLGVLMVAAMNFAFPRLPALYATLLLFAGQALAGVAIDSAATGTLEVRKLAGTLIVLAGLAANAVWGGARRKTTT